MKRVRPTETEEQQLAHKDQVREHYNQHAKPVTSTREALSQRAQSASFALKRFHNIIKRQLLLRFAKGKNTLLDLCCGRGGDILKWNEARLRYVRGVDISDQEIVEASRRFAEQQEKQTGRGWELDAEFQVERNLGEQPYDGDGPYDVVTCMFAMHYFFESESRLRMFLYNVSNNLAPGGYFIGTIPDAKRVLWHMGDSGHVNLPLLKLQKDWQGPGPYPSEGKPLPSSFGHSYYFAVPDTVTSGTMGSAEGSMEFLAFQTPIIRIAAHYGMVAVLDYEDPALNSLFEAESAGLAFKHFFPQFPHEVDMSLAVASSIFTAFVFRKLLPGEEMPCLDPPLPSQLPRQLPLPPAVETTPAAEDLPPPRADQQYQEHDQGSHGEEHPQGSGEQVCFEEGKEQNHHYWAEGNAGVDDAGDEQDSAGANKDLDEDGHSRQWYPPDIREEHLS